MLHHSRRPMPMPVSPYAWTPPAAWQRFRAGGGQSFGALLKDALGSVMDAGKIRRPERWR